MPSARASRRGVFLNCRLAVNGIQKADCSSSTCLCRLGAACSSPETLHCSGEAVHAAAQKTQCRNHSGARRIARRLQRRRSPQRDVYTSLADCQRDWATQGHAVRAGARRALRPTSYVLRPALLRRRLARVAGRKASPNAVEAREDAGHEPYVRTTSRSGFSGSRSSTTSRGGFGSSGRSSSQLACGAKAPSPAPNWRERCEEAGFHYPLDGRHLLGRVGLLCLQRRAGRPPRGGDRRAAPALPRRGRPRRTPSAASPLSPSPRRSTSSSRDSWRAARADALRPLRPLLGRRRRAQAARVQRRHADRAARSVASCSGTGWRTCRTGRRSVQLAAREADRARGRRCDSPRATNVLHLCLLSRTSDEDLGNVEYLRDCALQAGWDARQHRHRGPRLGRRALRRPRGGADRRRCSSSIPGSGWCARSSASTCSRARRGSSSRRGRCCCPTRRCWWCSGR